MKRVAFSALILALGLTVYFLLRQESAAVLPLSLAATTQAPDLRPATAAELAEPALLRQESQSELPSTEADTLFFVHSDAPNQAAADAAVTITSLPDMQVTEYRSGEDGALRIRLPRGVCLVQASSVQPGSVTHCSATEVVQVEEATLTHTVVLRARVHAGVEVLVLDRSGPVTDIPVAMSDGQRTARSRTGPTGRCVFQPAESERWVVLVGDLAATLARHQATETERASGLIVVQLSHATLTVELVDPFGLAEQVLALLRVSPDGEHSYDLFWYARGGERIVIQNVAPGDYQLSLCEFDPRQKLPNGPAYAPQAHLIDMGLEDQTFTCTLNPTARLTLTIEAQDGTTVDSARVRMEQLPSKVTLLSSSTDRNVRGGDTFPIPTGKCLLHLDHPDHGYAQLELNVLPGDQLTRVVRLKKNEHRLLLEMPRALESALRQLKIYRSDGEWIREWGSVRVRLNFSFSGGGNEPTPPEPEYKTIDLGYFEGGPVRIVLTFNDGTRQELTHEFKDGHPLRLELP